MHRPAGYEESHEYDGHHNIEEPLRFHVIDGKGSRDANIVQKFVLKTGGATIRVGRAPNSELLAKHPAISGKHVELRLVTGTSAGGGSTTLVARDMSMNGTGLMAPGGQVALLTKYTDTLVHDGSVIVLPMKLTGKDDEPPRVCFLVRLGDVVPDQGTELPLMPMLDRGGRQVNESGESGPP